MTLLTTLLVMTGAAAPVSDSAYQERGAQEDYRFCIASCEYTDTCRRECMMPYEVHEDLWLKFMGSVIADANRAGASANEVFGAWFVDMSFTGETSSEVLSGAESTSELLERYGLTWGADGGLAVEISMTSAAMDGFKELPADEAMQAQTSWYYSQKLGRRIWTIDSTLSEDIGNALMVVGGATAAAGGIGLVILGSGGVAGPFLVAAALGGDMAFLLGAAYWTTGRMHDSDHTVYEDGSCSCDNGGYAEESAGDSDDSSEDDDDSSGGENGEGSDDSSADVCSDDGSSEDEDNCDDDGDGDDDGSSEDDSSADGSSVEDDDDDDDDDDSGEDDTTPIDPWFNTNGDNTFSPLAQWGELCSFAVCLGNVRAVSHEEVFAVIERIEARGGPQADVILIDPVVVEGGRNPIFDVSCIEHPERPGCPDGAP